MARAKKPHCLLCKERPAKSLSAVDRNNNTYVNADAVPIFCSRRCATNWALLYATADCETHWNEASGEWEFLM